ncbi:ATP-grasp fold amidoligase family protein [Aeromonas veronii]|uniref:ATP-grasp fold amidoligase family protein n=1 Tax=Aeromonas veronii TaxID=654 RepID=UPI0027DCED55|nr:ATP-grasp fold amidoligase family protein [Aeromonas veronii]WMJ03798.1 ATP-grasp fold amidoligase family protein [Aeromonas veronii]
MGLRKEVKNFVRDTLRFILGSKKYNKLRFILTHKYYPNFVSPRTFSEKIFARKYDVLSNSFSSYVDKYSVRSYVRDTIGEKYLVPLLKFTTDVTPEFFSDLPERFVMKTSNGGGGENVKVVLNKAELGDLARLSKRFNSYLQCRIGSKIDEKFYDIEPARLIVEKLLMHQDGSLPSDYKLHIFQGSDDENEKVIIQVDTDRFECHKRSLYSESLRKLEFDIQPKYMGVDANYIFPNNMAEMIALAKQLAKPFPYVRIDMYNVDGDIYFGEMTFCHGSGWEPLSSKEADYLLGSYWKEYDF